VPPESRALLPPPPGAAPAGETAGAPALAETRRLVQRIVDLPTLPTVIPTVFRLAEDHRSSARDLARVIANDQSLASRILRLANSAFYGFAREITSINQAVVLLGFETVKSIVLASTVFSTLGAGEAASPFDRQAFWLHAVAAATAARILGRGRKGLDLEEAFVSGLLHDVGKVVLDRFFAGRYGQAVRLAEARQCLLREAEAAVFGVDHAEIGRWLAERWRLPHGIVAAVAHHHCPADSTGSSAELVAAVHLADVVARNAGIGSGGDPLVPLPDPEALARLGAGPAHLAHWTQALAAEAPGVNAFFLEML